MAIVVKDSFNRANTNFSATGLGRADTGQTWQQFHDGWARIRNNTAETADYDDEGQVINSGLTDFILQADFLTTDANTQLIIRANLSNGSYTFVERNNGGGWYLYYYNGGSSWTTLASAGTFTPIPCTVKVIVVGQSISVYRNGDLIMTAQDSTNLTSTYQGIGTGSNYAVFDNYSVESLDPDETTEHLSASVLRGVGRLQSTGKIIRNYKVNLKGKGFLSASHITIKNTQANLLGVGSLSASSKDISIITGSADLTGQGLLESDGQIETHAESSLFGHGSLNADAERHAIGSIHMIGQGKIAVSTSDVSIVTAGAGLAGIGSMSANGRKEASSSIHMLGKGVFNVNVSDVTIITASAGLKGSGHIATEGLRIANIHLKLSGEGRLGATGERIAQSTSDMTASGLLTVKGHRIIIADAELIGKGLLKIVDGEPAIGTINLKGKRELYVYLKAKQSLYVDLKARQELIIHLRGDINMTMENQNFNMYAGDTKYIKFPIDGVESLTGSTIKWGIREDKHSNKNIVLKDANVVDEQAQIKLDPADTAELNGTYFHECELTDTLGNVSTILTGRVTINKSGVLR